MSSLASENDRHGAARDHHVLRALRNPLVLQVAVILFLTIGSYIGFLLVAPQLLAAATGYDPIRVSYLVSAGGVLSVIGMLASGWHSERLGERFSHLIGSIVIAAACFAIMAFGTGAAPMLIGYFGLALAWPAVTLSACLVLTEIVPSKMVAVAIAAANTVAQLGAFLAPTLWGISKDMTGSYQLGLSLVPLAFLLAAAISIALLVQVRRATPGPSTLAPA